jgi:hypothetical protein
MAKPKSDDTYVLSIRIPTAVMRGLKTLADRDRRSTANFIRIVLSEVVENNEFKVKA